MSMPVDIRLIEVLMETDFAVDRGIEAIQRRASGTATFRDAMFASSTGFVRAVALEIEIAIAGRMLRNSEIEQFVAFWGLKSIQHKKIAELSGGWRRILMLSLFFEVNQHCSQLILINGFRFVAPNHIWRMIERLSVIWSGELWALESDAASIRQSGLVVRECALAEIGSI